MLKSRARIGKGTKTWDKIVLGLFGTMYLAIVIVAALDAGRFRISEMPFWLWPVGAMMYCFFLIVTTWAMAVNPFFEKTVRIQHDRGHKVIDSGPYRIVRHPGYLATIIGFIFATPFLLGSWWAFIPTCIAAASIIIRTFLEDRTLRNELSGYEDYARRIRYRLLPGVW
jgi:protein-S-isoprenylcysteine O-methyltransferase Ste14